MANVIFFDQLETLRAKLADISQPYTAVFVLCDNNTETHCLPHISSVIPTAFIISIRSGEQYKNLETCTTIWSVLTSKFADRKALFINLGGGVICDMGGFAASCYKRGIDFVHIPTTLLAMADASVGGKTGIDFDRYKNQIGAFAEARNVMICSSFLATLDARPINSGLAEVVKHYLIADANAFQSLSKSKNIIPDKTLIEKAVAIKSQFVTADPFEKNVRKALNFGHTIGHAIESYYLSSGDPLLHGEAVAIGMTIETIISNKLGLLTSDKTNNVLSTLKNIFDLRKIPAADIDQIIHLTAQDKKNTAQQLKFVLLTDIGQYRIDVDVAADIIKEATESYNALL